MSNQPKQTFFNEVESTSEYKTYDFEAINKSEFIIVPHIITLKIS